MAYSISFREVIKIFHFIIMYLNFDWSFLELLCAQYENVLIKEVFEVIKSYRFSAFWLRSKCSICSYQLNI